MGGQGQMMMGMGNLEWHDHICVSEQAPCLQRMAIRRGGGGQGKTETRGSQVCFGVQIRDDKMPELERQQSRVGFNPNAAICWICDLREIN